MIVAKVGALNDAATVSPYCVETDATVPETGAHERKRPPVNSGVHSRVIVESQTYA